MKYLPLPIFTIIASYILFAMLLNDPNPTNWDNKEVFALLICITASIYAWRVRSI